MPKYQAVILAAGEATRMHSGLPKMLHPVCGKPSLDHILSAVREAGVEKPIVVVAKDKNEVRDHLQGLDVDIAEQDHQTGKGTGHAAMSAVPFIDPEAACVFVLASDMPLMQPQVLIELRERVTCGNWAAALTCVVKRDPTGYGRIVRDKNGDCEAIVEHRDCSDAQLLIREVNASMFCFQPQKLLEALPKIKNKNTQREYYLTDAVEILRRGGEKLAVIVAPEINGWGINDRIQLAEAERAMRSVINQRHMRSGVTILDPRATYIDCDVAIGQDTTIYPGCVIEGNSVIGARCVIEPFCHLRDAAVGDGCRIRQSSVVGAEIPAGSVVGPFAAL